MVFSKHQKKRSDLLQKVLKKDLDPVLDPPRKKDLKSDHLPKKGSRSGSLDPGSIDPKGMLMGNAISEFYACSYDPSFTLKAR